MQAGMREVRRGLCECQLEGVRGRSKEGRQTGKCVRGPKSHKHNICTISEKILQNINTLL